MLNNHELSETEKLTAIKYWPRMNKLTGFTWKYSTKTRNLSKNDKFVTNKTRIYYFVTVLSFFNFHLIVLLPHAIISENYLNGTKTMIQHRKNEKATHRRHATKLFSN